MGYIACLPESVVSNLRSSIVLSDIPQIVEELVCNSLDAEATQVNVQILAEDLQVVVEDNGCGITESDFKLLGERHATSKIQNLADLENGIKTLGFRGEALSSLADVALVDITSRARGCPNAFRKTMKGRNTLSFKRSSEPKGSGTRVAAREIFGNQPVRRRLFGTNQKKVLQAVRERVLRLALMHPRAAIVVKAKARQVIFQSRPVESLGNAMIDIFGSELTSSLEELDFAKGNLRLSGFLSKLSHGLSSQTVQFFYINRRFVQKTPVHKLLNTFDCNHSEVDLKENCRKKNSFAAFVLNLTCPFDYDITFEASKTLVEFAEWNPVLSFVRDILSTVWGGRGHLDEATPWDPRQDSELKAKEEPANRTKSLQVSPSTAQNSKMRMQFEDPFCEDRPSRQYSLTEDREPTAFEEALLVKEMSAMSPRKKLKVVGSPFSSMMATDTDTMLQGSSGITSYIGSFWANDAEPVGLSYEQQSGPRKRGKAFIKEARKQVNESTAALWSEPCSGSRVRGKPQAFGACILPEDLMLNPLSPDLSFESPGRLDDILSDSSARGLGTRLNSSRNVFEDMESSWQLTRCNQDQVVTSPWWDSTPRSPDHLLVGSKQAHTRRYSGSVSENLRPCLSPLEQGSPTELQFHPHNYGSFPTPECLRSGRDPPRTRSSEWFETSFRFQEEQLDMQKTPSTHLVEPTEVQYLSHVSTDGAKVEEGSEVAMSKYRGKRWPASFGAELEDARRQESVAEIYQAWISESARVEGREIIDIATSGDHNLVPEALTKEKLQHARVLQQVDKKFIAVVAKGVLVLVDQHAADERVRLEQLRKEVLESAKPKAVTALDQPEELILTPMNQQVLETYSGKIEHWGWRFRIVPQILSSRAGGERACKVLLNAVPNILQTQLTSQDLTDYLNQLRETHGSSAAPPAVTRILNYKSCRGSIMFGDILLPSECHQLVAHLQQTSLCFQCAHGRPTMIPLVNLPAVHKCYSPVAGENKFGGAKSVDIRECEVQTPDGKKVFKTFRSISGRPPKGTTSYWHGLEQGLPASLERARVRLENAQRM